MDGLSGSFAAGYAYYPTNPDKYYYTFLLQSTVTKSYLRHVLAHEFGHSMGLRHTFEGGCAGFGDECSTKGDLVCDTEPHTTLNCSGTNSCTGEAYGGVATNVMNYSSCSYLNFTEGQSERALFQLKNYRNNLINSTLMDVITPLDTVKSAFTNTPKPSWIIMVVVQELYNLMINRKFQILILLLLQQEAMKILYLKIVMKIKVLQKYIIKLKIL